MGSRVLVTGASGFVGSHLATALVAEGHDVRAMTRRPDDYSGAGTPVHGDVFADEGLDRALRDVDVAYYLVHSLDSTDFESQDATAARAFGAAAADAGVRQVIYLGGLGAEDEELSPHLRSRRQVESLLAEAGVPVTTLRAAIVVGAGGSSWEILRRLAGSTPLLVGPDWLETRTQPIALGDVVRYLVGVLDHPAALGRTLQVGCRDPLTYAEMLSRAGLLLNGREVAVLGLPVVKVPGADALAADFMGFCLSLLGGIDRATAQHLLASMGTEVVVTDSAIRDLVPFEPLDYDEMVRVALDEGDPDRQRVPG